MSSSSPVITSHPNFRALSDDYFKPYPPYALVNSEADARAVLGAGCEAGYLVVLDASAPDGTKKLTSSNTKEYKERIGILIFTLPSKPLHTDLSSLAAQFLTLLSIGGTMIGFAKSEESEGWKQACTEWAQREKAVDAEGKEQDGVVVEWSGSRDDVREDGWVAWGVVKKAPEWAFC